MRGRVIGSTARAVLTAVDLEPQATVRKLAEMVGVQSTSTVQLHLDTLHRLGLVRWQLCSCCGALNRRLTEEARSYLLT
jgi:DNA-binding IclR family transcriptional regulator